jgi:MscS family membrane protein
VLGLPAYSIVTSLGFGGIAFALAAKETVANFIGGVVLLLDHPFRIGDYVDVADARRGEVIHIGARSTRILTRDDILVTVPNSTIVNETISNESGELPRLRVRVKVGVAYGSDLRKVESILLKVAHDNPLVMGQPEPHVRFREFSDSSVNFELLCRTQYPADRGKLIHQLGAAIYDEFNKSGIEIPFPQRDVHLANPQLELTSPGDLRSHS